MSAHFLRERPLSTSSRLTWVCGFACLLDKKTGWFLLLSFDSDADTNIRYTVDKNTVRGPSGFLRCGGRYVVYGQKYKSLLTPSSPSRPYQYITSRTHRNTNMRRMMCVCLPVCSGEARCSNALVCINTTPCNFARTSMVTVLAV